MLYNNNEVKDAELLYLHLKDLAEEGSFELKKVMNQESSKTKESVENRPIINKIRNLGIGETLLLKSVSFEDLYNIKYPVECEEDPSYMFFWNTIKIHAKRKTKRYRVWMVSRFGDIGITPDLKNPNGYTERTEYIDKFYYWEFTKEKELTVKQ